MASFTKENLEDMEDCRNCFFVADVCNLSRGDTEFKCTHWCPSQSTDGLRYYQVPANAEVSCEYWKHQLTDVELKNKLDELEYENERLKTLLKGVNDV